MLSSEWIDTIVGCSVVLCVIWLYTYYQSNTQQANIRDLIDSLYLLDLRIKEIERRNNTQEESITDHFQKLHIKLNGLRFADRPLRYPGIPSGLPPGRPVRYPDLHPPPSYTGV